MEPMNADIAELGNGKSRGFSLVELLVVIAIIALLTVLTVPAFQSIAFGSSLARGGQMVADQFALARQMAVSRNGQVQVRVIWLTNNPPGYQAVQLWGQGNTPTDLMPLSQPVVLPEGVSIASNAALSPLLNDPVLATLQDHATFSGRGKLDYRGFRFKAGGRTDLPYNASNAFLTVVATREAGKTSLPNNYCLVQVDPVSGRVKSYRP